MSGLACASDNDLNATAQSSGAAKYSVVEPIGGTPGLGARNVSSTGGVWGSGILTAASEAITIARVTPSGTYYDIQVTEKVVKVSIGSQKRDNGDRLRECGREDRGKDRKIKQE